jgi:hypothetical protein
MTAAPTVWDAADDYFPAAHPVKLVVRPVSAIVVEPQVRSVVHKPAVHKLLKPGGTSPRMLRPRAAPAAGRRRT